ncbi:MAG: HlyD family efflux transporter periplasmic adaptor subunit [Boseongicola sp. SB0670_bin_30]|nr:HlyD family efflux transporter periplasmic adaptor subunit [Boseongicola sp. SB0670_bin_30]
MMRYDFGEIHVLNLLSDNPEFGKRFKVPRDLRIMTGLVLLIMTTAVACAILLKVDKIVPANGVLETQAKLFELRASETGFVQEVVAMEGQSLRANDVVIRLDPRPIELLLETLTQEQETYARSLWTSYYQVSEHVDPAIRTSVLRELATVKDVIEDLGYKELLKGTLRDKLELINRSIASLERAHDHGAVRIGLATERLHLARKELERRQALMSEGFGARAAHERQQQEVLAIESELAVLAASAEANSSERDRLAAERKMIKNDFVSERLARLHDDLDEFRQNTLEQEGLERRLNDLQMRAPFDAVVDEIMALGTREVVDASTSLAVLRPLYGSDNLKVDMKVPSNFAIWVRRGMQFRASSMGNSPEDHGYMRGRIDFVSRSTEIVNGTRMYRMTGVIEEIDLTSRPDRTEAQETFLRPGLQLAVQITVGKRRLINYLVDPLTNGLRSALTEPS